MYKKIFIFILNFFLTLTILFMIYVGYKLYNRIKFNQTRISNLEHLVPKYELEKKLNKLEIEKIYLTELSRVRINKFNFELKKLQLEQKDLIPTGYLDINKQNLIFVSGNGNIFYEDLNLVYNYKNEEKLKFKKLNNNLSDKCGVNNLKEHDVKGLFVTSFVRDTFVDEGWFYVVCNRFSKADKQVYVEPIVLKAKFNLEVDKLNFEIFFISNEKIFFYSINESNQVVEINDIIDFRHSGGRLQKYKNEKFIYAIPDYNLLDKVEDLDSIYGKILLIDEDKNYEIFSYGHRNQQGLLYDIDRDIILSTEHGPTGGDEINLIKKSKGYGWPKVSKGKGYTNHVISMDHKNNGYEEPIYYWETNPGISEIIKVYKNKNFEDYDRAFVSNSYLAASLHGSEEWSGRSLWNFKLDNKNKVSDMKKIFLNDRVRDLVYDTKNEKILLILENQSALAIINTLKNNFLHNSF